MNENNNNQNDSLDPIKDQPQPLDRPFTPKNMNQISDYKEMYQDEILKNNTLQFLLQQRELQIEKLFKELANKEVKTTLIRNPNEVILRKQLEIKQKQTNQAQELIERYIEVIEDLYKLIEKITGTKINHECLEALKKDKEKIMKYDETNQKLMNLNNIDKENTPEHTRSKSVNTNDEINQKYQKLIALKNHKEKKQILLEFDLNIENQLVNIITDKILNVQNVKASFVDGTKKMELTKIQPKKTSSSANKYIPLQSSTNIKSVGPPKSNQTLKQSVSSKTLPVFSRAVSPFQKSLVQTIKNKSPQIKYTSTVDRSKSPQFGNYQSPYAQVNKPTAREQLNSLKRQSIPSLNKSSSYKKQPQKQIQIDSNNQSRITKEQSSQNASQNKVFNDVIEQFQDPNDESVNG